MASTNFYESLPIIEESELLTDPRRYSEIPDSWYLVLVNVDGIGDVLAAGRYRDAHTLTAAAVVAATNAVPGQRFPNYLCAGGTRLFVPRERLWEISRALLGLKQLAQRRFNITLSVGYISAKNIRDGAIMFGSLAHEAHHRLCRLVSLERALSTLNIYSLFATRM
jgi:hypothetical protein